MKKREMKKTESLANKSWEQENETKKQSFREKRPFISKMLGYTLFIPAIILLAVASLIYNLLLCHIDKYVFKKEIYEGPLAIVQNIPGAIYFFIITYFLGDEGI